jgi:polyphosphate kinase
MHASMTQVMLFGAIAVVSLNTLVHRQILAQIIVANLRDNEQSWILNSNGTYTRTVPDKESFNAITFS